MHMRYFTFLWKSTSGCLLKVEQTSSSKPSPSLIVDESLSTKLRLFIKHLIMTMNNSDTLHPSLRPPECVKGMTSLKKDLFKKTVTVPGIKLPMKQINLNQKAWKPLLLKLRGLRPIASLDVKDPLESSHNLILLNPAKLEPNNENTGNLDKLRHLGFQPESLEEYEIEIGFDNWSVSDVMKAVLPLDADNVSSFTQIGHIAHLNLKEENLKFKHLIGEVIVDKITSVRTVVNKLNSIDNTYRNFEMELLAGENNFFTQTKEHNCVFEFDFSKVYWNSRLSTEHQRIVEAIPKASIVYDIFAGVGPFTIPLAKKRDCTIFANDLNPHSFSSLDKNIKINKLSNGSVQTYNMDGREFIRSVVKKDLSKRIGVAFEKLSNLKQSAVAESNESASSAKDFVSLNTYAVMNLPALAVDFLDAFVSLLADLPAKFQDPKIIDPVLPTIYCYAFCTQKDDIENEVKKRAENVLNQDLPSGAFVRIVRNVSPNKEMVCLTFKLQSDIVLAVDGSIKQNDQDSAEPDNKRPKYS